ncbi:tRNA dimethylallyltransferase, mitochondrial [Elasticomyces elasticus]|nr:tRNA dimethylallyltransferase, mitochondrial [Elasticomyces elasticus]KAK4988742.1 tRNA dimethylallyltransferase, mitochondrial [Elasticomyces elasticus]KAK5009172.1 hypothetical protein LTR28_002329 [Elasticomyces elasticus]
MSHRSPANPLIAIIGATGTGKSQLAVELATRFNGEIINGDAMQLYAGLPIITNKVSQAERKGIPHHLLGCIGLEEQTWTVGTFVENALGIIQEIRSRGRVPILVGGTHYYTQSLLFRDALATEKPDSKPEERENQTWPILQESTDVMLEKLREVDPIMADRWHPNDYRKIQRSLEIWLQTGRKASDIYQEQQSSRDAFSAAQRDTNNTAVDAPTQSLLRFPTLLFWIHAETDVLRERLDKRAYKMLSAGLLTEVQTLETFARKQQAVGEPVDESRGIWVSIGYKEFKPYQDALTHGDTNRRLLEQLCGEAIEKMQAGTRQYAKGQTRWIRIKLLHALSAAKAKGNLFVLDGTDLEHWLSNVRQPAEELVQHFLGGQELPEPAQVSPSAAHMLTPKREYDMSTQRDSWVRQTCEICNVTAVRESDWTQHVQSRGHRKAIRSIEKRTDTNISASPDTSQAGQVRTEPVATDAVEVK